MFRKLTLATVITIAVSAAGMVGSANAHIGGRGSGIRIGGGLIPRTRQQGNANGNRNAGNPGVAHRANPAPIPAPKVNAGPPVVQIGGAKSSKSLPANSTAKPTTPNSGTVLSNHAITNPAPKNASGQQAPKAQPQTPVPNPPQAPSADLVAESQPKKPANSNANYPSHMVFNLTGNANAAEAPVEQPTGLSLETKQALEEVLENDAPAEIATTDVVSKEVVSKEIPLPQIPVGATVTLNGKDLSDKEGQVVLQIGEIALPATVTAWQNNSVTCTLPVLGLTKASKATLHVLNADGKTASMFNCELITMLPSAADAKASGIDSGKFGR